MIDSQWDSAPGEDFELKNGPKSTLCIYNLLNTSVMLFCTVASSRRNYQTPQLLGTAAQPAVSLFCASWRFWIMHRELSVERNPMIYT